MHKRSSEPFGGFGACPYCAEPFCTRRHEPQHQDRRRHSVPQGGSGGGGVSARDMPPVLLSKAAVLVEDLRSPTLWPFSAVCLPGEKPTTPGWELSPEEMRWEAYQEIRLRGVCTKYQIQARLMRKDANAHREHVIRELVELEEKRIAEADQMMNAPAGPVLEGFSFRGFAAPATEPSPFPFGTPGLIDPTLGRVHANPTPAFSKPHVAPAPAFGRPNVAPTPSGLQGRQQPPMNLFGARTPAAQGFTFKDAFGFQRPAPAGPFGTRLGLSTAQPVPTVATSVSAVQSDAPTATKPQPPATPSSATAQHAVPVASASLYPTHLERRQPQPNPFVPPTATKSQSVETSSAPSQTSQEPIATARTPAGSSLDLSTIAESLPKTPPTTAAVKVIAPLPVNTNGADSQSESPSRSLSSPTKSTDGNSRDSSPDAPLETRKDQAKAQETTRTIKLFCVIVGQGSVFPVSVDTGDCVGDLKEAIAEKKQRAINCDADELRLYAARQPDNEAWMTSDPYTSTDMKALKAGATTANLQSLMADELELDATCDISDYFDANTPSRRVVHLLVVPPSLSPSAA